MVVRMPKFPPSAYHMDIRQALSDNSLKGEQDA